MMSRRHALGLTVHGVAALLASAPKLVGCGSRKPFTEAGITPPRGTQNNPSSLDWLDFVSSLSSMAHAQYAPDWNQERYVEDVIDLMRQLNLSGAIVEGFYDDYVNAKGLFPEISSVHEGGHFAVATLEFDAGDRIRLHNHPDMTGVILCIKGSVDVEAFDLLDRKSPQGNLLIERVLDERLYPGQFATLTANRGNIHALVAQEHTELLDVFTPPYDSKRLQSYRWYRRSEQPVGEERTFEAWEV